MRTLEKLEKLLAIIGSIFAGSVAVAQIILLKGDRSKPTHFAIYLLSQTGPEVVLLLLLILMYWAARQCIVSESVQIVRQSRLRLAVFGLVALVLLTAFGAEIFYFARARRAFWTWISTKAYVESYKKQIDNLARTGRLKEAYDLLQTVVDTSSTAAAEKTLEARRIALAAALKRSDQLYDRAGTGSWNPITQRREYGELVEAVRVNPQNYQAADRLERQVKLLERSFLPRDLKTICASGGDLNNFSGYATSFIEARLRWIEQGQNPNCLNRLQDLRDAWQLDSVECILAVSSSTRTAFSENESVKQKVQCLNNKRLYEHEPDYQDGYGLAPPPGSGD